MGSLPPVITDVNPMNFTENQHGNSILEKLKMQKDEGKYCDITLFVEKTKFQLHRNVLASFSPYFERMLIPRRTSSEIFDITCQNPEVFQYFVAYMYTGSIIVHANNVQDLLKLAHRLEVSKLKMYCAEYLERYLDLTNCIAVKRMAEKFGLPNLNNHVQLFISSQLNSVLNGKEILNLEVHDLSEFLSEKEIGLGSAQALRVILEWVKVDVSSRMFCFKQLLKVIKWNDMDLDVINNITEQETLFASSEMSLYIYLLHLNEQGINIMKFRGIYENLRLKYESVTFQDIKKEPFANISKVNLEKRHKRKKRLLRNNPLLRLAALRSALLVKKKRKRRKIAKPESADKKSQISEQQDGTNVPLKCHLCDHFANDTTTLEQHLSSFHARDVTYKCGVCGYVCQWNNLYIEHIRGHFPGPPYKCDSCEYSCDKLNEVMTHRSVHLDEKSFKCNQCSFRSRAQSTLAAHSKCHTINQEKNGHNGNEPRNYVCDLCGFNTKYLSHLIAHKRIHSADVYRCTYPQCKFTTGTKTQLGSHARSHQGVRPHCCQICGRGFLEKSHLVRHERIHLEEKPFKCHECDYASSRRDKLKEHQARHHGDNASAKVPYKARPNKKSQLYQDGYSPSEGGGRSAHVTHSASSTDIQEVLAQHTSSAAINYTAFPSSDSHSHHASATTSTLDFHQQQLLTSTTRAKEHRSVQQTTVAAAAVTAAMMLDPRFHHSTTGGGSYVTPVTSIVGQPPTQVGQPGHQVSEYPTALMSLF